ncbi:MAG: DUF5715 family protein [Gemmatimonadota bacterium]
MRNALLSALLVVAGVVPAQAQSLRGSPASLDRQNRIAQQHDYTYLRNRSHVRKFVGLGLLVRVRPTRHLDLGAVSFPYTRPEVKLFIDRLSAQYHSACGETLVVTSLTRPNASQPRNASPRSVHPTGMALDIRRSRSRACRRWLENTLLSLEQARVLEATRERRPPHYHVAIYPRQYEGYVASLRRRQEQQPRLASAVSGSGSGQYTVGRGDTLWDIAKQVGASVESIKAANGLRTSRIYPGQTLKVPASSP